MREKGRGREKVESFVVRTFREKTQGKMRYDSTKN